MITNRNANVPKGSSRVWGTVGDLIKKGNTGVDTGDNTGLNPFYQVTQCFTFLRKAEILIGFISPTE